MHVLYISIHMILVLASRLRINLHLVVQKRGDGGGGGGGFCPPLLLSLGKDKEDEGTSHVQDRYDAKEDSPLPDCLLKKKKETTTKDYNHKKGSSTQFIVHVTWIHVCKYKDTGTWTYTYKSQTQTHTYKHMVRHTPTNADKPTDADTDMRRHTITNTDTGIHAQTQAVQIYNPKQRQKHTRTDAVTDIHLQTLTKAYT